jgi:SpoVK/Ycf46/Vps4 family AAA+-type ATPase
LERRDLDIMGMRQVDERIFMNLLPTQTFDADSLQFVMLAPDAVNVEGMDLFMPMLLGVDVIVGEPREDAEVPDDALFVNLQSTPEDDDAELVDMRHFRKAVESVRPTITDEIVDYYERMEEEFAGGSTVQDRTGSGRIGFQ